MTAILQWNRLQIEADGDKDFKKALDKNLPKLLELPYERLEVDLGRCTNLGEASFKLVGTRIVESADKKQFTLRVGIDWKNYVQGTGLSSLIDVSVVDHMDGSSKSSALLEEDKDAAALQPVDDEAEELEAEQRDETHPPEDINQTKIQTAAKNGALVDEEDGKRYDVGEEMVIGREPPSDPVFAVPTISKRHFRIYQQGPGYFIEDMRSTNGTYLNGNPLTQPQPLGEGDEVVVAITLKHPDGAKRFKFTLKG